MAKLNLYAGWFPSAELPSGERYMELLTAPEAPRQRPKAEVRALVMYEERGRIKHGFFHGVDADGRVVIARIILPHEKCERQTVEIAGFVTRDLKEVNICPL